MPIFTRTIGIDYSGAGTPTASLKGLRVYMADDDRLPVEVSPPSSSRKYWTRKGIAEWLVERLAEDVPTLVGIDHGLRCPKCQKARRGFLTDETFTNKQVTLSAARLELDVVLVRRNNAGAPHRFVSSNWLYAIRGSLSYKTTR